VGLFLQAVEESVFLDDSILNIKIASFFVLTLSEFTVFSDEVLALVGSPDFVIKLLFLVAFALDELDHTSFSLLSIKLVHDGVLLGHEAGTTLLSSLFTPVINR
jgi:hypothetical protein